jgi:CBS domain-containing protein
MKRVSATLVAMAPDGTTTREMQSTPQESERFRGACSDEITIGEVMHAGVFFCPPESPLRYAARLMAHHRVHAVVVIGDDEEGGVWGLVSDTDVIAAIAQRELDRHTAGGIARTPVVTVSRSDSVVRAAELMKKHAVAHLLVESAGRRPVGVVSTLDLACAVSAGMVDEVAGTPK